MAPRCWCACQVRSVRTTSVEGGARRDSKRLWDAGRRAPTSLRVNERHSSGWRSVAVFAVSAAVAADSGSSATSTPTRQPESIASALTHGWISSKSAVASSPAARISSSIDPGWKS
eukprot:318904-Prymnesium_polylepis.2